MFFEIQHSNNNTVNEINMTLIVPQCQLLKGDTVNLGFEKNTVLITITIFNNQLLKINDLLMLNFD